MNSGKVSPPKTKRNNHNVRNNDSDSSKNDVNKSIQEDLRSAINQINPSLNVNEEVQLATFTAAWNLSSTWLARTPAPVTSDNIEIKLTNWTKDLEGENYPSSNLLIILKWQGLRQILFSRATKEPKKEDQSLRSNAFSLINNWKKSEWIQPELVHYPSLCSWRRQTNLGIKNCWQHTMQGNNP